MNVQISSTWRVTKSLTLAASIALLAGCSTFGGSDPSEPKFVDDMTRTGAVKHSFEDPTVVSLWQTAEQYRQTGDFTSAFKTMRKAVEVAPTDPVIWSRLSELALRLSKPEAAEKYSMHSNKLTFDNNALLYRNWLIVQRARETQNDIVGAEQALKNANQYRP